MMSAKQLDQPEFMGGLKGELCIDEPMSRHTSWRTGGQADFFYTPSDKDDLVQLIRQIPADMPVHWVGLGSNLLVRDGGIRGLVIRTSKGLREIQLLDSQRVYAESGVSCAKVARFTTGNGLAGAEFLAGVPGSFGGALAMNAGAFGGETWEHVESIECLDRQGQLHQYPASAIATGYRSVDIPGGNWIVAGILILSEVDEAARNDAGFGRSKIRSLLEKRASTQPVQTANAGSVFRNPEGDHAARLIEAAGLKGRSIGGATISTVHANFIVNTGEATSADIEQLIALAREQVREQSQIELELEVRILGENP